MGLLPSEGTFTHHRGRSVQHESPRRPAIRIFGPGGSWGPALPRTGPGHILGEQNFRIGSRLCVAMPGPPPRPAFISSQNPVIPRASHAPHPLGTGAPPPHPQPHPGPLTTAVAGAARVLLEVGEEPVAGLQVGRGPHTDSGYTLPRGHRAQSPGGRDSSQPPALPSPWTPGSQHFLSGPMFLLEKAS